MSSTFDRFDQFQKEAVASITADFKRRPNGRFLLVIPTGGGKTFTAVKAVCRMFEESILDKRNHRVAWVAHREEMLEQASTTFEKYQAQRSAGYVFKDNVDFLMTSQIRAYLEDSDTTKLVIIDEAHHGAAPSYLPIFEETSLGVLGLTATPTRHDGAPLEFDRESYSIGFPDLVEKGIVLRPNVVNIRGGRFSIRSLDEKNCLEQLNTVERNQQIIAALYEGHEKYKKIVIFVGTKAHVKSIYSQILNSELMVHYESVAWITGDGNSRDEERKEFLHKERERERSILVNVQVLSEGYDDPSINTIVMASPTRSKLVYMQAMGRSIRRNPDDEGKRAYILEVTDDLPNIRYRIDNRWLYSDVSDALEPAVIDREFNSETSLREKSRLIFDEYLVPDQYRKDFVYKEHDRYGLLLFKVYAGQAHYFHFPILISNDNRQSVSNMFNFLSERMRDYVQNQINARSAFQMIDTVGISSLVNDRDKRYVFDAMSNAASNEENLCKEGPWITFVTFNFYENESKLPAEILAFVEGMINRDEIVARVTTGAFESAAVLVRLPLPLASFVGKILRKAEYVEVADVIDRLKKIKQEFGTEDHREKVIEVLDYTTIPLEPVHRSSLVLIVREDLNFSLELH